MHPAGAPEYSLQRLLNDIAPDVDMVVFPNYVSFFSVPPYWPATGLSAFLTSGSSSGVRILSNLV